MNIAESKRKLKALKILATVCAHKKRTAYEQLSEQNHLAQRLQAECEFIEQNIDAASTSLNTSALETGVFCPELYSAKLDYLNVLYEHRGSCEASIAKNNLIIGQAKNTLSDITSRTNLVDDKYMTEKMKYITQVIKQQEAQ